MLHSLDCILAKLIQWGIIEINFQYLIQETIRSRFSMARTGLGPWKIILAKDSSSHPVWIMYKMTCRLTSWLSFVVYNCEFVTFPLVTWVRCGTWLYQFLIFVPLLTVETIMSVLASQGEWAIRVRAIEVLLYKVAISKLKWHCRVSSKVNSKSNG